MRIYVVMKTPGMGISASQEVYTLDKARDVQKAIAGTVITFSIQDIIELLRILKKYPNRIANTIAKLEEYV